MATDRGARAGSGLLILGVVFMAFGAGGFLGFAVGRSPAFAAQPAPQPQESVLLKLTEKHANEAEYLLRRRAKL